MIKKINKKTCRWEKDIDNTSVSKQKSFSSYIRTSSQLCWWFKSVSIGLLKSSWRREECDIFVCCEDGDGEDDDGEWGCPSCVDGTWKLEMANFFVVAHRRDDWFYNQGKKYYE